MRAAVARRRPRHRERRSPLVLEPSDGSEQPKLGNYFVYQGDGDDPDARGVRLQNTASAADERRWGYRFDLQRMGDGWRVEGFMPLSRFW